MKPRWMMVMGIAALTLGQAAQAAMLDLGPTAEARITDGRSITPGDVTVQTNSDGRAIRVGDNASNKAFHGYVIFDISGLTDTVTEATFRLARSTFVPPGGGQGVVGSPSSLDLVGVIASTTNGVIAGAISDGAAFVDAAGAQIDTLATSITPSVGDNLFDVTAWVEARRAAGDTHVAFRLDATAVSNNGVADNWQFADSVGGGESGNPPQLSATFVPEPASLALLSLSSLLMLRRRSRR